MARHLALLLTAASPAILLCSCAPEGGQSPFAEIHGFEPHFVLPPDVPNIRNIKTDFGAVGDGKHDDTEAFVKAFGSNEPRAIYIPDGTYLIRKQIRYGMQGAQKKKVVVIGESRAGTVLRLADRADGFGDPDNPKVFWHMRRDKQHAEQNFFMYLMHLTIEIGEGNLGAVALQFHTNNTGVLKDIDVRAADPVAHPGHTGIRLGKWFGPGSMRYVSIAGFDTGIDVTDNNNICVFEHIRVSDCSVGMRATGVATTLRGLVVRGAETGVINDDRTAHMVLLDSEIRGDGEAALVNRGGGLLARNLHTSGFSKAIRSDTPGGDVEAGARSVVEYHSHPPRHLWPPTAEPANSLGLPVPEEPELQYPQSAKDWAVMPATGDITDEMQQAIDADKRTIFIPRGDQSYSAPVYLRGDVERVMGLGRAALKREGDASFVLADGEPETVFLELVYGATVVQASDRTLVFRFTSGHYRTAPEGAGGRVFLNSTVGRPYHFRNVDAWARDFDVETGPPAENNVVNDGARLWILGHKTEDYSTKLLTRNGGFTELLGASYRQNWNEEDGFGPEMIRDNPLLVIDDAHASFSFRTSSWRGPEYQYGILVREKRGGEVREWQNPGRNRVEITPVSLYVGYQKRPGR